MSVFIIYVILAIVAGFIAGRKNYSYLVCVLLGILGLIGVVVAVVLPQRPPRRQIGR
jgi:hypothetical protein